jgi:hypothetical protein
VPGIDGLAWKKWRGSTISFKVSGMEVPAEYSSLVSSTAKSRRESNVIDSAQIASGTMAMAPHGHSCAHTPQPLQKS